MIAGVVFQMKVDGKLMFPLFKDYISYREVEILVRNLGHKTEIIFVGASNIYDYSGRSEQGIKIADDADLNKIVNLKNMKELKLIEL